MRWQHEAEPIAELVLGEGVERRCFACGKPNPASSCAKCGVASYCSRTCQTQDWSAKSGKWGGHKAQCAAYKALGRDQRLAPAARRAALEGLLAKVRLYLCPFALAHGSGAMRRPTPPRGCCFLQIGCTLTQLALPAPRDCAGAPLAAGERSALLHWVTMAEYDAEIVPTDAALAAARAPLADAVAAHDDAAEVVVLARAACGFVGVVVTPLVPERRVSLQLAAEYEGREALQLDLDDL
jgi:hypothetical protein